MQTKDREAVRMFYRRNWKSWINYVVFNADELESKLARLTAENISKKGNFAVASKVSRAFTEITSRRRTVDKEGND